MLFEWALPTTIVLTLNRATGVFFDPVSFEIPPRPWFNSSKSTPAKLDFSLFSHHWNMANSPHFSDLSAI